MKILVLGSTGMLGHVVAKTLKKNSDLNITTVSRRKNSSDFIINNLDEIPAIINTLAPEYVINCIGLVKPFIQNNFPETVLNAVQVNSIFPLELEKSAAEVNSKIIQIATDCVYSGLKGSYTEKDEHDPDDVYGKTKSLGEVNSDLFMNIRCSIIGPNPFGKHSLFNWVQTSPKDAVLNGFVNHNWNGVTTLAFSEIVNRIINENLFISGTTHLVPLNSVTKYELLKFIAISTGRTDIVVNKVEADFQIDRTLSTIFPERNRSLWGVTTDSQIPSIYDLKF